MPVVSRCMAYITVHNSILLSDNSKLMQARTQQSHLGLLLKDGDPVASFGKAPCGSKASYASSNNCNVQGLAAGACPAPGGIEPSDSSWCWLEASMREACSLHVVNQHGPLQPFISISQSFDLSKQEWQWTKTVSRASRTCLYVYACR